MSVKIIIAFLVTLTIMTGILHAQQKLENFPVLKGAYLGQKPPGLTPELFAPGIISTDAHEGSSGFDKESKHFVFQRIINGKVLTYEIERENNLWTQPKLVPFANMMENGDFVFAPDGKTLFFQSNTPVKGLESDGRISNIWVIVRSKTGWTTPEPLDFTINTKWLDSFASATNDGTLYFFTRKPGGRGKSDLYKSKYSGGKYTEAINLGPQFNSEEHEWDPFIAPDESYLVFCSTKAGGYGSDDFYISFRSKNGDWSKPVNMGDKINSMGSDNRPYVTPDGNYFFFTSTKRGNRDIYWVDAKILLTFKPEK